MFNTLYSLPTWGMAAAIIGLMAVIAVVVEVASAAFGATAFGRTVKGVVPTMLVGTGTIAALLLAFVANGVWSDNAEAKAAVAAEARALQEVVLLADSLPPLRDEMRGTVAAYIRKTLDEEWPAMAEGRHSHAAGHTLSSALLLAARAADGAPGSAQTLRILIDDLDEAVEARMRRLSLSLSRISPLKWGILLGLIVITMATIGVCHLEQRPARRVGLTLYALSAAGAIFIVMAHDRPFTGPVAIGPQPLEQLLVELAGH